MPPTGVFPREAGQLRSFGVLKRPFGAHKGARTRVVKTAYGASSRPQTDFVLTATHGGGLAGVELSAGLELALPALDVAHVYNEAHRLIGQLYAPETAPATLDTVQVDFAEDLPAGATSFGLVKLRGRVVWQSEGHHLLRFHRQMPVGWPEGDHHEADESALTGRTAGVGSASLRFGVPLLTPDRTMVWTTTVDGLDEVLAWLRGLGGRGAGARPGANAGLPHPRPRPFAASAAHGAPVRPAPRRPPPRAYSPTHAPVAPLGAAGAPSCQRRRDAPRTPRRPGPRLRVCAGAMALADGGVPLNGSTGRTRRRLYAALRAGPRSTGHRTDPAPLAAPRAAQGAERAGVGVRNRLDTGRGKGRGRAAGLGP